MSQFHTIFVPKKLTSDILIACFLLQKFGEEVYPGIEKSQIEVVKDLPEGKESWLLEDEGIISIFFKEATFPRGAGQSVSRAVAIKLGVIDKYVVHALVSLAEGRLTKETESVSRLMQNIINQYADRSHKTYWTIRPMLQAQMSKLERDFKELPEKYTTTYEAGKVEACEFEREGQNVRVVFVESNEPAMSHFLHTHEDISADVVCQQFSSGTVRITTCADMDIDLSDVVALLRLSEITNKEKHELISVNELRMPGMIAGGEEWFFDAKNQYLEHKPKMHEHKTSLSLEDVKKYLTLGLDALNHSIKERSKSQVFDLYTRNREEKRTKEDQDFREGRLNELEGRVYELEKKDVVVMK